MRVVHWIQGTAPAEDGFSKPYMIAMALGTFVYGFLALWISFRLARKYVREEWAFLATLGVWFATSFTFYLYVDPSYSHTHSAFLTALFVWLWESTRGCRTWRHWLGLGIIAGFMLDTYYPNAFVLLLPLVESLWSYRNALRARSRQQFVGLAVNNVIFGVTAIVLFLPTLMVKKVLFGSYFQMGYRERLFWNSPHFFQVSFSSHGLYSWTPILILAVVGLFLLRKSDRVLSYGLLGILLAFTYFIGCYEYWHAQPSFGNRFFITFTVVFVLGLGALLNEFERMPLKRLALAGTLTVTSLFIVWNFGVMYQFAFLLPPARKGETVSWSQVVHNQVTVVPGQVSRLVKASLEQRLGIKLSDEQNSSPHDLPPAELGR